MGKLIDITGQKFGRLTVIEMAGRSKSGRVLWRCKCDCGNEKIVKGVELRKGCVCSCGCLHKDVMAKVNRQTKTTHGGVHSRLYSIWRGMKKRCYCENSEAYHNYGGRGIKVCDEWKESFENFMKWAMQSGYDAKLTIDRIDVNGDYTPQNCKWSTTREQQLNKRNNHLLTMNGVTHPISKWAEITGISKNVLLDRTKRGWDDEKTLTTPPLNRGKKKGVI